MNDLSNSRMKSINTLCIRPSYPPLLIMSCFIQNTVNSEIFVRVSFLRNFTNAKFVKIKHSRNGEITLSLTDVCKSCPGREFYPGKYVFLPLCAKIKFSLKISEFIVVPPYERA